jgi:L-ornithine Nalpha-acyltransferase
LLEAVMGFDAWKDQLQPIAFGTQFGEMQVRLALSEKDMHAVQALRADRFRGVHSISDLDRFDPLCAHLLVQRGAAEMPLAAARFRLLVGSADILSSYCAQFYDLGALAQSGLRVMEIGRICLRAGHEDQADIPRALLAGLTRAAQVLAADMLVGCASFHGADPAAHRNALRYLQARHLGPEGLRPGKGAGQSYDLHLAADTPQPQDLRHVPALLRLYLGLGGWVSDHAVCDPDLNTLHVFTAVDVHAIPPARLRALSQLAQG